MSHFIAKSFAMLIAFVTLSFVSSSAWALTAAEQKKLEAALDKAVNAALNGPEIKKLKVAGHEFNVKKANIGRNGNTMTIKGQISHHLSLRSDDQLYYTIVKVDNKVVSVEMKIDRGGLAPIAAKLIGKYVGLSILEPQMEALLRHIGSKIDGKWETAAEMIVASVGVRATQQGKDGLQIYRARLKAGGGTLQKLKTVPAQRVPLQLVK